MHKLTGKRAKKISLLQSQLEEVKNKEVKEIQDVEETIETSVVAEALIVEGFQHLANSPRAKEVSDLEAPAQKDASLTVTLEEETHNITERLLKGDVVQVFFDRKVPKLRRGANIVMKAKAIP